MSLSSPATPDPAKAPDPAAMPARIIALPGLPPDADAQALMPALGKPPEKPLADPDLNRLVPVAAVQEMLRDRNARLATPSEAAAGAKVDDALRRGCITPGLKDRALALCRQDPDAFDGFRSLALPAFAHLTKDAGARRLSGLARRCRRNARRAGDLRSTGPAARFVFAT